MTNDTTKFTPTHEWLTVIDGEMVVGITNHAQQLLGDLVFVELPEIGKRVKAGDELGVIESVKAAADFYAPISGVITAINEEISKNVALINQSPEEEGWLVKMRADNIDEMANLLDKAQYQHHIAEEH